MSRDYQIISRLQSALYNVSKMYIDNMSIWNPDIDDKLAYLRAKTEAESSRKNLKNPVSVQRPKKRMSATCFERLPTRFSYSI